MKKNVVRILTAVLMLSVVFSSSVFAAEKEQSAWDAFVGFVTGNAITAEDTQVDGVTYRTHIQNDGWAQGWVSDGETSGSYGRSLRLEGIEIKIDGDTLPDGLGVTYRTQIENDGWLEWETDGDTSGSVGKGLRLEGIEIKLTGDNASDYSVRYKTHIQNKGWETDWKYDGELSGTVGEWLRLEGIQIEIIQKTADLTAYNAALAAVTKADYTAASWTTYQAVVNANVVDEDNLQSEVDAATEAITAAQANLVLVPKVTSVTAINGTQLLVTFNKLADKTTAEDVSKYSLDGVALSPSTATAALQTDEKSVIVTLVTPYANTSSHSVAVTISGILEKGSASSTFAKFSTVITINDLTPPTISSVTALTNGSTVASITVNYSEPVQAGAAIKIDGTKVATTTAVQKQVLTGLSLDASKSHTVEIVNLTDAAGNVTGLANISFTATTDTVAPKIATVTAANDKEFIVEFSKKMNASTIATGDFAVAKSATLASVTVTGVAPLTGDTTGTKFVVTTGLTAGDYTSVTTIPLTIAVAEKVMTDEAGNGNLASTNSVTLTKDTVAPVLQSTTFTKGTNGEVATVVFTFDENIAAGAGSVQVLNKSSIVQSGFVTGSSVSGKVLTLTIKTGIKDGQYSFSLPAGYVTDTSTSLNKSVAISQVLDFGASTTTEFTITPGAASNAIGGDNTNVITVNYGTTNVVGGAFAGSATDAARYTLNGSALPATAQLILLDATHAQITLPVGSVPTTDAFAVLQITGVKSTDGLVNKPYTQSINITDNVAPVLQSAQLLADGQTFVLTYDENMDTTMAASNIASGFTFTEDGSAVTVGTATVTSVAGKTVIVNGATRTAPVAPVATIAGAQASKVAAPADLTGLTTVATTTYTVQANGLDIVATGGAPATLTGALDASGNGTVTIGGKAFTITGAVASDVFTITTTAATTSQVAFNTAKTVTLTTTSAANVVEDVATNDQKANVVITTTR